MVKTRSNKYSTPASNFPPNSTPHPFVTAAKDEAIFYHVRTPMVGGSRRAHPPVPSEPSAQEIALTDYNPALEFSPAKQHPRPAPSLRRAKPLWHVILCIGTRHEVC